MKKFIESVLCCVALLCLAGYIVHEVTMLDISFLLQVGALILPAYVFAAIVLMKNRKNSFKRKKNNEDES